MKAATSQGIDTRIHSRRVLLIREHGTLPSLMSRPLLSLRVLEETGHSADHRR